MQRALRLGTAAVLAALCTAATLRGETDAGPRRVLIISSFGSRIAPWDTFAAILRTEVARGWSGPVEFLETPLELARTEGEDEAAFAGYLGTLASARRPDLVVTVGGPAAHFVARHHAGLFDAVPLLIIALDRRQAADLPVLPNAVVAPIALDPPAVVENILRLLPETRQIVVVIGDSPLERFWKAELERDLKPFSSRVSFVWFNALSLDEMRRRAGDLPAGSAILYGALAVDARGVLHEADEGLAALRAVAKAPMFGAFEHQMGEGIVGGPLLSSGSIARTDAGLALRLLDRQQPERIAVPAPERAHDVYDWRELKRFRIAESRLPKGSEIRFRPPSLWEAYRGPFLLGLAIVALQALLIAALLAERSGRRDAERRVHALNRRLLTAQEDERKAIARELHDDFSQRLARLAIDAARLEYSAAVPVEAPTRSTMRDELARLSDDANALAYQLHPSTLDELGLAEALRTECDRFSRLESIPVALDLPHGMPEPSRETSLCLFRIAQEGLRNVARHARAKNVTLSCVPREDGLELRLRDDGIGFEPGRRRTRPSLGLASMRERVEVLGGRFGVDTNSKGTTIVAWAPREAGAA